MSEPVTLQRFKYTKELSDKLKAVRPVIETRLAELTTKLQRAIDSLDEANIKLYLKALEGEKHLMTTAMETVATALRNIADIEDDEDFLNTRLKDLEAVSGPVDEAKKSFDKRYAAAMVLERSAKAAAVKAKSQGTVLTDQLAELDKEIADVEQLVVPAAKKADTIERLAGSAIIDRDEKALKKQKDDFDALDVPGIVSGYGNVQENLVWAVKSVKDATLDAASRKELNDDLSSFADRIKDLKADVQNLDDMRKTVPDMSIAKIDVGKAAKALSIERKGEAPLAKILGLPSDKWASGLDGLARQLGMKTTGKDMVKLLDKARIA